MGLDRAVHDQTFAPGALVLRTPVIVGYTSLNLVGYQGLSKQRPTATRTCLHIRASSPVFWMSGHMGHVCVDHLQRPLYAPLHGSGAIEENEHLQAVLNVALADGSEVGRTLQERAVPIVLFSEGGVHYPQIRDLVPEAVWFQKPTDYRNVVDALDGLTP